MHFKKCSKDSSKCIEYLNELIFEPKLENGEEYYNDAFFLKVYARMCESLSKFWMALHACEYWPSWVLLQDALDYSDELIKQDTLSFELDFRELYRNLKMIESLYPYFMFQSPGKLIKKYVCSICGKSFNDGCQHVPGQIYWGVMANRVILDFEILEISLTDNPADKRSVVFKNNGEFDYSLLKGLLKYSDNPLQIIRVYDKNDGKQFEVSSEYISLPPNLIKS